MEIFLATDYRAYLRNWAENRAEKRGAFARMAEHLGISSTMISQVLSGTKSLSPEMTDRLVEFLGLSELEADYFFLLVEFDRAGTKSLKDRLMRKIKVLQSKTKELASRLKEDKVLDESAKAIYYSSWIFSGIRNLTAIEGCQTIEQLESALKISREAVTRAVNFMLEQGLLERGANDKLSPASKMTFLPAKSPLIVKHHHNWRLRAFQKMDEFREDDFFFTGPFSMSKELAIEIRAEFPTLIEKIVKRIGPSPSETVRCLNLDWFEY